MNILASLTPLPGHKAPDSPAGAVQGPSNDPTLAVALRILAGDLGSLLANFGILSEVAEARAWCRSLARREPQSREPAHMLQRLDDMVTSLVHNTRRTGDPFGFRSKLIDLQDILGLALSLNRPLAENRNVLLVDDGARPVTLIADRQLLLEAADVLVAHAIGRSPAGGCVTCLAERRGGLALLHVADDGETLNEAAVARAMNPFASAPGDQNEAGPIDLEVWYARLIAYRHGGGIVATSPVGSRGNLFTLSLPDSFH